jgi:hypothetical protein
MFRNEKVERRNSICGNKWLIKNQDMAYWRVLNFTNIKEKNGK